MNQYVTGAVIKGLREKNKMTQLQLAEKLGVSDKTISKWETEKGYLYVIDEPITVGIDVYQHPRTVMDENAEFLTKRPIKVKIIREL